MEASNETFGKCQYSGLIYLTFATLVVNKNFTKRHKHTVRASSARETPEASLEYVVTGSNLCFPRHCNRMCVWLIDSVTLNPLRAQCVAWLVIRKLDTQAQRRLRTTYRKMPLSKTSMSIWYKQFEETGSILHTRVAGCPRVSDKTLEGTCKVFVRSSSTVSRHELWTVHPISFGKTTPRTVPFLDNSWIQS
jgi:hypothetical protein